MNELGYITQYNLLHADDSLIWKSAAISAIMQANIILNEDVNTQSHQERWQWANNVLSNADEWVKQHRWDIIQSLMNNNQPVNDILVNTSVVSSTDVIGDSITDDEIDAAISTLVPAQPSIIVVNPPSPIKV